MASGLAVPPKTPTVTTMNPPTRFVLWEMLLLFASILVFRSAWMLLDRLDWTGTTAGLWTLLLAGTVLCVLAFRVINEN